MPKVQIKVSQIFYYYFLSFFISVIRSWQLHESSEALKQPKDFTKINKSLLQKSTHGEKENEKELRKKLGNIRKKVKQGHKPQKLNIPNTDRVYGLPSPKHEDIADIIYNTYGNKAEEDLKKSYEAFISEKSKVYHRPKVVPRFISPKVELMKKKEEERKANNLDLPLIEEENKEPEKPLYKLKMFQNVGSRVAEEIKKFRTYKPFIAKHEKKEIKEEIEKTGIDKVIEDVKKDVEKKEEIEQIGNEMNI